MAAAPTAGAGFFPLDEELGLLPGCLTPRLHEAAVRLSTHIPSFAKAATELAFFTHVHLHPDTLRRRTEDAGRVLVAHQHADAVRLLREHPAPPAGPEKLLLSVDGAMIPLQHGVWTEVRTLVVGEVQPAVVTPAGPQIRTTHLSYFARRLDSASFADQALGELHRRGIETARQIGAVVDGAEWCQQFLDLHAPTALRILDFPHAAEYVSAIGQTPTATGPLCSAEALAQLRHRLKHEGPEGVVADLRMLIARQPHLVELPKLLAYLDKRVAQMAYPAFQQHGWPIGSGMVESANKLLVEDRLKGAGMHWAEGNVNPMLALRCLLANDRWEEGWAVIEGEQRRQLQLRRQERRQRARQRQPPRAHTQPSTGAGNPQPAQAVPQRAGGPAPHAPHTATRPAANHPWRRAWSSRQQRKEAGAA